MEGSTRTSLDLINTISKGNKINTQNPVVFEYTNNKHNDKEIRETIPFTIASKQKKIS